MIFTRTIPPKPRAMTLMEIMMVVAVITILIAIGFGTFRGFNKSTSTSTAQGQISAALGIARAQAMANQEITGILFYIPTSPLTFSDYKPVINKNNTGRQICVTFVRATEVRGYLNMSAVNKDNPINPDPEVVLDMIDMDPFYLPDNVGIQTVISTLPDYYRSLYVDKNTGKDKNISRIQETYLGFNRLPLDNKTYLSSPIGGVILFDQSGQLVQLRYAFRMKYSNLKDPTQYTPTLFFSTIFTGIDAQAVQFDDVHTFTKQVSYSGDPDKGKSPYSSPGLLLFDRSEFLKCGMINDNSAMPVNYTDDDPVLSNSEGDIDDYIKITKECNTDKVVSGIPSLSKEIWLDRNSIPFMISRYSGALQKVK
jgi:prepilin-type N-terminal cleavage/methylation domain-containing protein